MTAKPKLSDAGEVVQVVGADAANQRLPNGWALLAVVPSGASTLGPASVVYVLGKPKTGSVASEVQQHLNIGSNAANL